MMTVDMMKDMKVKKIDQDKADAVKRRKFVPEMRWCMSEWVVRDFQRGADWKASKCNDRGSV